MSDMKLIDMARTDAEKKAAQERYTTAIDADGPEYPYGLCLYLCKDELDKLGIDKLPEVGDEFHLFAIAKVTRVSQSADESGGDDGVSLQIVQMATMQEEDPAEKFSRNAAKLYGKG